MGSRFSIDVPLDYDLKRDVCSYGYFLLAPNVWEPQSQTLSRPLNLAGGIARVVIVQPGRKGTGLAVDADRALSRAERSEATRLIRRMLNLDDDSIKEFHKIDPRWKKSGRARIFRSPTLFEDIVKTVTSCNVTWPGTMNMNRRLCEVISPAFPTARELARKKPATLRSRCGVGYRDVRLIELAKLELAGELDEEWFEDPSVEDDEIYKSLLRLPGIGPYAASNILQLLGRYSRLALDTEAVKHGRTVLGFDGTDAQVQRQVAAHFEKFGRHRFRSYWFEMWNISEQKHGPAWTWRASEAGRVLTQKSG